MATRTGMFDGASSNISGKGYAGMNFKVFSSTQQDFDSWVNTARVDGADFGAQEYKQLALPSENNEVKVFSLTDDSLFDKVLIKYMNATSTDQSTELVDQSERSF
jgi:cytochrome o ubiquinol oxidase subunit 2